MVVNGAEDPEGPAGAEEGGAHVALRPQAPQHFVVRELIGDPVTHVADRPVQHVPARGPWERILDVLDEAPVDAPCQGSQPVPGNDLGHGGVLDSQSARQPQYDRLEEGLSCPARTSGNVTEGVLYSPLPEGPIRNVGEVGQGRLALHDVVGSARAHDLHGHPLAALAGHDHHWRQRPLRAATEKVDTLPVGEPPVGDDDVRRRFGLEGPPGRLHRRPATVTDGKAAGPGIESPPGQLGVSGVVLHQEHLERAQAVPIRDLRRLTTGRALPPVRWNPCDKFFLH